MALQIKGSSQIQNESITLNKIVDVASGTILGRSEDSAGDGVMAALSGADIRKIAELHSDDSPTFAAASLTGALSAASASLTGNIAAADANLTGDLNADGDVGGATATITGNATVGGTLDASGAFTAASATLSGAMSSASISTSANAAIGGDLTVTGDLIVNGDSVQVNVSTLQVEDPMIKLGQSNSADSLDLGFYGLYNDGSDKYAGLFRDQNDSGKFKLFDGITSEPTTTVADVSSNKATLVADIEGDITFATARTFSLSGDVAGSQTFDGSGNCEIAATIQADSVEFSMLACEIDEDDMSSNSDSHVPTQQSVKAYVDAQVASNGQSGLEAKDMLMVDSSGGYVKVKEIIEYIEVSTAGEAEVDIEVEAQFDELSMIFLNGQKLRFSDDAGTSNDYYFENNDAGAFKKLSCDMFESGDEIEVRYFILS